MLENSDEVFKDKNVNVVIVATPAQTHYDIVKKALHANKHVFCEKPLTLSHGQDLELKEIAEENNLTLHCDLSFLYYAECVMED